MDLNNLNSVQRAKLREWLLGAFRQQEFEILLADMGKNLAQIAGARANFTEVVFETIDFSQREGWTDKLVEAAQQERPNKLDIKSILRTAGELGGEETPPPHLADGSKREGDLLGRFPARLRFASIAVLALV